MISRDFLTRFFTSIPLIIILILSFKYPIILKIVLIFISIISWFEFKKLISKIFKNIYYKLLMNLFSLIYLSSFSLALFIFISNDEYKTLMSYLFLICIFSDIGGLIFGKVFKGKKLTKISPNKTVSGSIGSFFSSLALAPIYFLFFSNESLINLFIIALFVSLFCQIGDLLISFLKRKANVEDTGNILPGHGGLLDRIDGMLFAIPLGIILLMLLTKGL